MASFYLGLENGIYPKLAEEAGAAKFAKFIYGTAIIFVVAIAGVLYKILPFQSEESDTDTDENDITEESSETGLLASIKDYVVGTFNNIVSSGSDAFNNIFSPHEDDLNTDMAEADISGDQLPTEGE